jgi:hypothetical protein
MAYDIETARVRIGLESTDTSRDVELTAAMDASLNFAEKYCDRFFMFQEDTAELIHFTDNDLQLHRYPITAVASVEADGNAVETDYHIEKKTGRIILDSRLYAHELTVSYSGGYAVLPSDLEMALWRLFDTTWSVVSATTSSAPVGGGAIKAISSSGARVEFDTSSGSSSGMSGSGGLSDPFAISILDLYALKSC